LQRLLETGVPIKAQHVYSSKQEAAIRAAGGDPTYWGSLKAPPTNVSQIDICFACAGASTSHISTCEKFVESPRTVTELAQDARPVVTRYADLMLCVECARFEGHAPNCSHNFQKRKPTFCTDCGVDLEERSHAPTCLRLNPSRMY
jgi:hypothetical protein